MTRIQIMAVVLVAGLGAASRPAAAQAALSVELNEPTINTALAALVESRALNFGSYANNLVSHWWLNLDGSWFVNVNSATADIVAPSGATNRVRLTTGLGATLQVNICNLFGATVSVGGAAWIDGDVTLTGNSAAGYKLTVRPTNLGYTTTLPSPLNELVLWIVSMAVDLNLPTIELNLGANLLPLGPCAAPTLSTNAAQTAFVASYPAASLACAASCPAGASCACGEPVVTAFTCGNAICEPGECCSTCPGDCGACAPPPPSCGDGTCQGSETCSSCAYDCGACPPPPPVCGDGACASGESCQTSGGSGQCQVDCGCCAGWTPVCFAAGTAITMADGSTRPIEEVTVGDQVAAYDERTGAVVSSTVSRTFVHDDGDRRLVRVNGELLVTGNHPFFANGKWVRADELALGDTLFALPDAHVAIPSATVAPRELRSLASAPSAPQVYNLEVAGSHTYFAAGILVHNKTGAGGCTSSGGGQL